jgi:site-specific DNA-methyltransferase (adenine-specific)
MLARRKIEPAFRTNYGVLYEADCLDVLAAVQPGIINTIFADPPFNLKKLYGVRSTDDRTEQAYLDWCKEWLSECVRTLADGGALFLYNLPKWNIQLAPLLTNLGLEFRHWIAVEQKNCLPIAGRLYPAHYSLLYFTKGKPTTFRKIRTPIETCRHCGGELKDYGGHRHAMNPLGVNLKDIWTDIPPVRHRKFKPGARTENALSTKLLDRVIEMTTLPGDLVLDPFGGSGTTYAVCEAKHRHWIGMELECVQSIKDRLNGSVQPHRNDDWVEPIVFREAAE